MIFGRHCALPVKRFDVEGLFQSTIDRAKAERKSLSEFSTFCHSPEGWRKLWIEDVFGGIDGKDERVKVDAKLTLEKDTINPEWNEWIMKWCIARL